MKTFKTELEIVNLVKEGNSIASQSDFSKLANIGKKWNRELIHGKQSNVQLWYDAVKAKYEALPLNDPFKIRAYNGLIPGLTQSQEANILFAYFEKLNIMDEYNFLCSGIWDKLQFFSTYTLGSYGIDTTGGATIFIKNGGDYYGYIGRYSKKHVEASALKQSTDLRKTIDSIFKGLEAPEKLHIANLIQMYANGQMDADLFHNTLFAGQ